jgi:catechol 2,3-dioxygenase-like lactoylglutathione lyase family enzyme
MFSDAFPIISTPDLKRALDFYRDLLDAEVEYQFPPDGQLADKTMDLETHVDALQRRVAGRWSAHQSGRLNRQAARTSFSAYSPGSPAAATSRATASAS